MKGILFSFFLLLSCSLPGQSLVKHIETFRTGQSVHINGKAEENDWTLAPAATDFIQNDPLPGATPAGDTEVRVLYDDDAVYIFASMKDSKPDSILKQLTQRDEIGITDWFGVIIDTYQDGNNGTGFFVTASGVQFDIKYSVAAQGNCDSYDLFCGDKNWDAVWDSEVSLTPEGWTVEMKIPYSALRFPKKPIQVWNINFSRMNRRLRELSFWNTVNPEGVGFLQQSGKINGLKNIKSPLRLSFTPYLATYVEDYYDRNEQPKHSWGKSISGGMDVKYGINDAFTVDLTLIPDFGEAQSDNQVLNLSPFEVKFDENRQFFTEGVELFNKGGYFYSRRVGGGPISFLGGGDSLGGGEEILEKPLETQWYNATKNLGRTSKGLGLGFFNAVAGSSFAKIKKENGEIQEIQTASLTNYNVMALDQNLPNNSYVTFLNTNVWRSGADYEANVSSAMYELRNKKNTYSLGGRVAVSQKYAPEDTELGHTVNANFGKTTGKWRWRTGYNEEGVNYDINDLGFLFAPNERSWWFNLSYNRYQPFGKFNSAGGGIYTEYYRLFAPSRFTSAGINTWGWAVTKNFWGFGFWTYHEPFNGRDYFEPRQENWKTFFTMPKSDNFGAYFNTDYRKKIALDVSSNYRDYETKGRYRFNWFVAPRFRLNDRFSFIFEVGTYTFINDRGYTTETDAGEIIFARRDQTTVENNARINYAFNNRMTVSFRMRHYWSKVHNKEFFELEENGDLSPSKYWDNHDFNFNAFNVDAIFRWRFAPGSDLFVIWKNAILDDGEVPAPDYFYDVKKRLFNAPQSNSLSIKLIYFIDYQYFVK